MTQRERFGVQKAPLFSNMKLLLLLFFSFLLNLSGSEAVGYSGKQIGVLTEFEHGVSGTVYAVDSRTIHIKGFNYDGLAPDAFFYTATSGDAPHGQGIIIPDENGGTLPLKGYRNKDVTLTLPDGLTLKDVPWFAVWCREYSVNFGHVMIPKTLDYPRPQKIDALPTFNHEVSSDKIVVVDAQTFLIPNFHYDGLAPDAFFWAGKGKPDTEGVRVPDENGSLEPLKKYSGKTIVITLPGDLTVFDIDYLGVWCRAFYVDFGHVVMPKNLNVPPSLKMLGVAPQSLPGYHNISPSLSSLINDFGPKPLSQHLPQIQHQPGTLPLSNKIIKKSPKPPPHPQSPQHLISPQSHFLNQGARPQIFHPPQSHFLSQRPISNHGVPPPSSPLHFQNINGSPLSASQLPHSVSQGSHRVPIGSPFNQQLFHPSQNQIGHQQLLPQSPPTVPHPSTLFHKSELKFAFKGNPEKASLASISGVKPLSFLSQSNHAIQNPVFPPQLPAQAQAHSHAHAHAHAPAPTPVLNNIASTQFGQAPQFYPNQNIRVTSQSVPIYFPSFENSHLQHNPYANQIHSPLLIQNNQGAGLRFPLHETLVSQSLKHSSPGHINSIPNGGGHLIDLKPQKDFDSQISLHQPPINYLNNFPRFNTAFRQRFPPIGGPRPLSSVRPISGQIVNSPVNFIPDHFRIQSNVGRVRRNF